MNKRSKRIINTIIIVSLLIVGSVGIKTVQALGDNETINENETIVVSETTSETTNLVKKDINEIKIPILMYHSISDNDPNNGLLVPINQFEEQMRWLNESGYTTMLMEDVLSAYETGLVPEKPIAVTFDDGYSDNYYDAYPILKKYNQNATFFVITKGIDDGYYMDLDMLKEMQDNGMSIENHTYDHREMSKISKEEQFISIGKGKDDLKEMLGYDSKFFCYPVGRYNNDTLDVLNQLGIKAAVTTNGGISEIDDGILTLDRIRISPMSLDAFIKRVEG
ncbi:MAG: polysaccharide deacetylase family protein [Clostridium sp.]